MFLNSKSFHNSYLRAITRVLMNTNNPNVHLKNLHYYSLPLIFAFHSATIVNGKLLDILDLEKS